MERFNVKVTDGKAGSTYDNRRVLRSFGLIWDAGARTWVKTDASRTDASEIRDFCVSSGLGCTIDPPLPAGAGFKKASGERNGDYSGGNKTPDGEQIPVTVTAVDGLRQTVYSRKELLKRNGFKWDGKHWSVTVPAAREEECVGFLKAAGLGAKVSDGVSTRSSDYRKTFFETNKPFWGNKYNCAYCGRRLKKERVQVDHIIAVNLAAKDASVRERIRRYGWESVNDPENLCASCPSCNRKKSDKGGLWIVRGRFGKTRRGQAWMAAGKAALFFLFDAMLLSVSPALLPAAVVVTLLGAALMY